MIAEAVDTARTLVVALLVWIAVGSAVATAVVYAVAVGVWCACRAVQRGVTAALALAGLRTDSLAPLAAELPASDSSHTADAERRSEPPPHPSPSWARKDAA